MNKTSRRDFLKLLGAAALAPVGSLLAQDAPQTAPFQRIPALEYHGVNYSDIYNNLMTPEWFQEQMRWLGENGYYGLNVNELRAFARESAPMPEKSVVLTFDLGRATSNLTDIIAPTLQQYGLHGIVYVQTDTSDNPFTIDSDEQREWWGRYRSWFDAGVISYGSHSVTHRSFYMLSRESALWELTESKRYIEGGIGVPIDSFAYPYEAVPRHFDIVAVLGEAGYATAFSGPTRGYQDLQVWPNDPAWFKLPRLLPYYADEYRIIENRYPGVTFAQLIQENTVP